MAKIQLLTGSRSGEVVLMRTKDIDMAGDVWRFTPEHHKNSHRGHEPIIVIGPRAQEILKPFLTGKAQGYIFSLAKGKSRFTSDAFNHAIARGIEAAFPVPNHLGRKIITPTGRKKKPRPETRKEWWTRLTEAERFEVTAWRKRYHWHAHQLRHTAATRLRKTFGLDEIQGILGHKTVAATQIYAELQGEKAVEVARLAG